jgi:hypothetical protein
VLMEFEDGGSVAKVAPLALEALGLEVAELDEGLLELAGEALAVDAERRKRRDGRGWGLGAGDRGLGAGDWARERTSASRSGMRLRRQEVSASSWTSWVSVGVAGRYSSRNWWWCCS